MDIRLIHLFNVALSTEERLDTTKVVVAGAKRGFAIHPDCCTHSVYQYVKSREMNVNSTFYRTWEDVSSKSRLELLIDQLMHYASTYGTNFEGEVYCPNGEPISINYKTYTAITPVTHEELYFMCVKMLSANIALAEDTVDALVKFVIEGVKKYQYKLNMDEISNREAQALLAAETGKMPSNGVDIVRVLYYKVFGDASMVMSKERLHQLHHNDMVKEKRILLTGLSKKSLVALSEVFLRYRKFLLAFKQCTRNRPIINTLRNMAKKNHKPMVKGFWERFTQMECIDPEELNKEIAKLDNNFKIVRLIQMIQLRQLQNVSKSRRLYTIRNGKIYADRVGEIAPFDVTWKVAQTELLHKLCCNLSDKLKQVVHEGYPIFVKFPKDFELSCPVSEKMFVGNYPFGTSMKLDAENNYFGVYWREEWGAYDFDLSYLDEKGDKIGWNSDFYDECFCYSGDMTRANPEASEVIVARGKVNFPSGALCVNRYNGEEGSKYRFYVGRDECPGFDKNYMVNPNSIILNADCESNSMETLLGFTKDNKFYLYRADIGNRQVAIARTDLIASYGDIARSFLPLRLALLGAGAIEYTEDHASRGIEPDIDLTKITRDSLINLFS